MKVFFDGGCRPNPGPIDVAVVFAGSAHVSTAIAIGDNNQAEWLALLRAVDLAIEAKLDDVVFIGDSVLIVEQARGRWPCRSEQLRSHLADFRLRSAAIPRVRVRQVPRSRNLAGLALAQHYLGRSPQAT